MSLYEDYIKERDGSDMIQTPAGFIIYSIAGSECFITDMYVKPSERGSSAAFELGDSVTQVAKEKKCTLLTSNIHINTPFDVASLRVQLRYGFKLLSAHNNVIVLGKEIDHG